MSGAPVMLVFNHNGNKRMHITKTENDKIMLPFWPRRLFHCNVYKNSLPKILRYRQKRNEHPHVRCSARYLITTRPITNYKREIQFDPNFTKPISLIMNFLTRYRHLYDIKRINDSNIEWMKEKDSHLNRGSNLVRIIHSMLIVKLLRIIIHRPVNRITQLSDKPT